MFLTKPVWSLGRGIWVLGHLVHKAFAPGTPESPSFLPPLWVPSSWSSRCVLGWPVLPPLLAALPGWPECSLVTRVHGG